MAVVVVVVGCRCRCCKSGLSLMKCSVERIFYSFFFTWWNNTLGVSERKRKRESGMLYEREGRGTRGNK